MMFNDLLEDVYTDWLIISKYDNYKDFHALFSIDSNKHRDHGGNVVYYLNDYRYPSIENNFKQHILETVKDHPITNIKFAKSWWVDYPVGAYSGVHTHTPGKQFTCILYLTDNETTSEYPYAGSLFAVSKKYGYKQISPQAGDLVIMDGNVWHGTYPTTSDRKVFVCDFTYEIGE